MADKYNLVSAELAPEVLAEVMELIRQIEARLPFLIALTKDNRTSLTWPGANGLEASASLAEAVAARPGLFPAEAVDVAEMKRDLALVKALTPIRDALSGLWQRIDDTVAAAGSDGYRAALRAYALAQVLMQLAPGLEAETAPFAAHLDRPSRRA